MRVILTPETLNYILSTIRIMESGNDYSINNPSAGSTASGAYQFINSTWNNYGGFKNAGSAPPNVQDAKAGEEVARILNKYNGELSKIPAVWYVGDHGAESKPYDFVPYQSAGNTKTIQQYIDDWMACYNEVSANNLSSAEDLFTGLDAKDDSDFKNLQSTGLYVLIFAALFFIALITYFLWIY